MVGWWGDSMSQSERRSFLNRQIPLWAAVVAVLIAITASWLFAFNMALLFVKTGIVDFGQGK